MGNLEFAVVDTETTGFFAEGTDRIIEVAIIRIDSAGHKLYEYTTLLNPGRDLGSTHVHGITARELKDAPRFSDIVGDIIHGLKGAVFAGHNVIFDHRFLSAELERTGYFMPPIPQLCTLRLAASLGAERGGRSLECCCRAYGIEIGRAHSAYDDACATAKLLCSCMSALQIAGGSLKDLIRNPSSESGTWPDVMPTQKSYTRLHALAAIEEERGYLSRLIAALPGTGAEHPELTSYLAMLDRALDDRKLSKDESDTLFKLAKELGLSHEQTRMAHRQCAHDLFCAAWADGIVTEAEERDLRHVMDMLSIPQAEYETLLTETQVEGKKSAMPHSGEEDLAGKTICFTGEFTCTKNGEIPTREYAEELAASKGMIVKGGVSKKLDILVAADADSMSSKARKAREYNVRIITEPVFWRMMGVRLD